MLKSFCVELGDRVPVFCEAVARYAYDGKHVFVDTHYPLSGRGVKLIGPASRDGWNTYELTNSAFDRLALTLHIVTREHLD